MRLSLHEQVLQFPGDFTTVEAAKQEAGARAFTVYLWIMQFLRWAVQEKDNPRERSFTSWIDPSSHISSRYAVSPIWMAW